MTTKRLVPRKAFIEEITNALNATVTFIDEHDYSAGELISFRVSRPFGMSEINQKIARVLATGDNWVVIDIDTLGFTPFIYPVSGKNTPPITVAAGSGVIPGVFPATINLEDCYDCVRVS